MEGVFTAVTETTLRVLAERRERLLREISEAMSNTRSAAEACTVALQKLATLLEEAPYSLAYLRDEETGCYRLLRHDARVAANDRLPDNVDLADPGTAAWFAEAQLRLLHDAAACLLARPDLPAAAPLVVCGAGAWLVQRRAPA